MYSLQNLQKNVFFLFEIMVYSKKSITFASDFGNDTETNNKKFNNKNNKKMITYALLSRKGEKRTETRLIVNQDYNKEKDWKDCYEIDNWEIVKWGIADDVTIDLWRVYR